MASAASALIIESVVVYLLVLLAHSLRHRAGLGPFYALLGGLTAIMSWVTDAGIQVDVGSVTFMVGSTVFYTALLLGVFVVYVFDGPLPTRTAILTIAAVSVLTPVTAFVLHAQMAAISPTPALLVPMPSLRINTASVATTIADLLFLAIAWEFLGKPRLKMGTWPRVYLTLLGVLVLDVVLFSTGAFAGTPGYLSIMSGTLLNRLAISVIAGPILFVYVHWQNKSRGAVIENRPVLTILTEVTGMRAELGVAKQEIERRQKAEAALRASEDRFRAFFEQSIDAAFVGSPDGRIVDVNQAWLDLFGYSRDELSRFNIADAYVNPADRQNFLQKMREFGTVTDEVRLRKKNGDIFDCARTSITRHDTRGRVIAVQGIMRDVTARKQAERALRESEERYRTLFEHSLDAIALASPGGLLIEANQTYLDLFGYSQDDIGTLNVEQQYPDEETRTAFLEWMATHDSVVDQEVRLRRRDGTIMDCVRNVAVRRDAGGNVIGEQCVVRDVTRTKRAETELRDSEQRFRTLFEQSMDAIYVVDLDGSHIQANAAWLTLFGYTIDDLSQINIIDIYANPDDRKNLLKAIERAGVIEDEVRFKKKDGTEFDCERTVIARRNEQGTIVAFQGIMRDVTQRKRDHAELERLARFDVLTGILNRRSIMEKLEEWVLHVRRYKGHLSVAMLDIDHFKKVNDDYGHQTGDHVLANTAHVVQRGVRMTDFAGRYGGEEFLIVLPKTNASGAGLMAERTRASLQATPMHNAEGTPFHVTVSIGIAEWCDGEDMDSLVARADAALYRAKAAGRNRVDIAAPN
ncbi:MAG: PAS domain S-box protein [Dehalococcoidia bacterium]|nr:PAS domain S-box protein [Dehalococcoidia bacterium]